MANYNTLAVEAEISKDFAKSLISYLKGSKTAKLDKSVKDALNAGRQEIYVYLYDNETASIKVYMSQQLPDLGYPYLCASALGKALKAQGATDVTYGFSQFHEVNPRLKVINTGYPKGRIVGKTTVQMLRVSQGWQPAEGGKQDPIFTLPTLHDFVAEVAHRSGQTEMTPYWLKVLDADNASYHVGHMCANASEINSKSEVQTPISEDDLYYLDQFLLAVQDNIDTMSVTFVNQTVNQYAE